MLAESISVILQPNGISNSCLGMLACFPHTNLITVLCRNAVAYPELLSMGGFGVRQGSYLSTSISRSNCPEGRDKDPCT